MAIRAYEKLVTAVAELLRIDATDSARNETYNTVLVQVLSGTSTLVYEQSNDGTTWTAVQGFDPGAANANTLSTTSVAGTWVFPLFARYFRIRVTVVGTASNVIAVASEACAYPWNTVTTVAAGLARNNTDLPVKIASSYTANPAANTSGRSTDLIATNIGAVVNKPYGIPEADWQFACAAAIAVNTDVQVNAAGAAGIRNYVTGFHYHNTNATATEIVLKDGATVVWRGFAPASMTGPAFVQFPTPLKGTAATALNFACITAGAAVYVNAQGYQAP